MASIVSLKAWNDPGFTEEGNERPSPSYTFPSPSFNISTELHPSAAALFSELVISAVWEDWRNVSYLEAVYSWNNAISDSTIRGWVDSVEVVSDSDQKPLVRIKWHVDEWGTYISSAGFGAGHIMRRPSGLEDPIQNYPHKYWRTRYVTDLVPVSRAIGGIQYTWWAIIAAGVTVSDEIKGVRYYTIPFNIGPGFDVYAKIRDDVRSFPRYDHLLHGNWDEMLGLDPTAIFGAWVVPCCPMKEAYLRGDGTYQTPFYTNAADSWIIEFSNGQTSYAYYRTSELLGVGYSDIYRSVNVSISAITPTELNPVHVTGFSGESLGTLPIGRTFTSCTYRVVATPTECYVEVRFDGTNSRINGTCYTIPALPLDLTSNAWSSYQYSGQRAHDIQAREESTLRGLGGIVGGGASGAVAGGFTPMGAGIGAALGMIGTAVGSAVDWFWYNEAAQNTEERLASAQSAGILISGGAWDAIAYGRTISLAYLEMDDYSYDCALDKRSQIGVSVDEFDMSFSFGSGFYQVVNLIVTGNIPSSAKRSISQTFARGVRII